MSADISAFSARLNVSDFQDDLDREAAAFDISAGTRYELDGVYHQAPVDDRKAKGKTGYIGEWRTSDRYIRHPTVTIHTHRNGGQSQFYSGLKRVYELYRDAPGAQLPHAIDSSPPTHCLPDAQAVAPQPHYRVGQVQKILRAALPLDHARAADAWRYLHTRALDDLVGDPPRLGFVPKLGYWCQSGDKPVCLGHYSALIGLLQARDGAICGIHHTYLDPGGASKLALNDPDTGELLPAKKSLALHDGATNGAGICLYPPGDTLAIAEGIETALAIRIATGLPVWACGSAGAMSRLLVPESVQEVVICADADRSQTGERAAHTLADRLVKRGTRVRIVLPTSIYPIPSNTKSLDWADILQGKHHEYCRRGSASSNPGCFARGWR